MANYNEMINSTPVTLVEFFATWCPHCQRMMPIVAEIRDELDGKVNVFQFDIDKNQDLASQNEVESVPTFIIYRDGTEVWRSSGEQTEATLLEKLRLAADGI
ncbi:MAG: thioredoxin family protein [Muribaculum sp.]|nr:thioredoxin family protein [Muribaculaceae bacterium]MCM1080694.1 thioredoxin family protein [Muribaculum sp.]